MRGKPLLALILAALLLTTACSNETKPSPGAVTARPPAGTIPPAADVPRDGPWDLTLPAGLSAEQVEGVTVSQEARLIPTTATVRGNGISITPGAPYDRSASYTIRLFAAGGRYYEGTFTTGKYLRMQPGQVYEVGAQPELGFHFAYYLYTPAGLKQGSPHRILVQPSDTGAVSDSLPYHAEQARKQLQPGTPLRALADQLGVSVLVPALPYPASPEGLHVQALNRTALLTGQKPFARADLQLIAMLKDVRQMLATSGIQAEERILLHGAGAAGQFADRFALLHPDLVQAVAVGNTGGVITLPLSSYSGKTLRYPVGVADLEAATGIQFRPEAYRQVSRLVHIDSSMRRDYVAEKDFFEPADADLIKSLFGAQLLLDRWERFQQAARELNLPVRFITAPGGASQTEIIAFFREVAK